MGLLEKIFFRNTIFPIKNIDLDINKGSIGNKIQLGGSILEIEKNLGYPISWWKMYKYSQWIYPQLGIAVECAKDTINTIQIGLNKNTGLYFDIEKNLFEPYKGTIIINNNKLHAKGLNPNIVKEILGKPKQEEVDEEEITLEYEMEHYIGFDFNLDESIKYIFISKVYIYQ